MGEGFDLLPIYWKSDLYTLEVDKLFFLPVTGDGPMLEGVSKQSNGRSTSFQDPLRIQLTKILIDLLLRIMPRIF